MDDSESQIYISSDNYLRLLLGIFPLLYLFFVIINNMKY